MCTIEHPILLIADDEPSNLELLVRLIETSRETFTVLQAIHGLMACEIAAKRVPDIILMDWDMPVMTGLEAVQCLKRDPRTADIPVIMTTGVMLSAGDLKTALEAGSTDYLRKPLDPVELMARIHSALDLSRSIRRAKAQNDELSKVNRRLQEAMENVKTLSGLLPICANCKKIRDDRGYWNEVEAFIRARSGAEFSHGLCPECEKKFFT